MGAGWVGGTGAQAAAGASGGSLALRDQEERGPYREQAPRVVPEPSDSLPAPFMAGGESRDPAAGSRRVSARIRSQVSDSKAPTWKP